MLKKLLQAGILMLEGKAYRQFIQAFVDDEDRRRFEKAFGKNGHIDYSQWGKEKGVHILNVFRKISGRDPVWLENRACFGLMETLKDAPSGKLSFVYKNEAWYIENKSQCNPN